MAKPPEKPARAEAPEQSELVAAAVQHIGTAKPNLEVRLSRELVGLLSEQLYQSPVKAIEELVVNAYDADASTCRIALPSGDGSGGAILVFDDGVGMDEEGLSDLWHVGHSRKREEQVEKARKRKQIGKFGIGKLSTYAVANRLTYISRVKDVVLATSLDYAAFKDDPSGGGVPVELPVVEVPVDKLLEHAPLVATLERAGVDVKALSAPGRSWTMVVLEELKPKAEALTLGRLKWVISTAMPLRADFRVFVDGTEIESSKAAYDLIAEFTLDQLPEQRLKRLAERTGEEWKPINGGLQSASFPSGVLGSAVVTKRSLYEGKSADLQRSNGFFVKVRGRLVNEADALFGVEPLSYQTFNRFRADIEADDLDASVTAPREGVETSPQRSKLQQLLAEVFYEARARYDIWEQKQTKGEKTKREDERNYVNPRLVEAPVADALLGAAEEAAAGSEAGSEADEDWFYLRLPDGVDAKEVLNRLYRQERDFTYTYERTQMGPNARLVHFDPVNARFSINADHDFVRAHDDGAATPLLEDVVTAEALLEVYLRTEGVHPHTVGEVLERRDVLLRSLSKDRIYSLESIATALRVARDDERDLEVALVVACRALGFVAQHVSGANEPDGLARFRDYPQEEQKITLEAKSSKDVPALGAIDFAGLHQHMVDNKADGCLLLGPDYPGGSKEDDAAAAKRAKELKISCWRIEDLARVVDVAEERHITARQVLQIVVTAFTPDQVAAAVDDLLAAPDWAQSDLYREVVAAFRALEGRLEDSPRTIDIIAAEVSRGTTFSGVERGEVERAVRDLAAASQGALVLRDQRVTLNTSIDELERRLAGLLKDAGQPRRASTFRTPKPKS